MTYGQNGTLLRQELTTLLRQHRIQQRLGGAGSHTIPESTTAEERELLGQQIRRYRGAALGWCVHAVMEANPRINLGGSTERSRGPVEEFRHRLLESIRMSNAGIASMKELSVEQKYPIVESWRQIAKAAVLGEHDFAGDLARGRMSQQECMTVLTDAAEVTRALVVLDKRYEGIPGWIPIRVRGRLDRAAEVCAAFAGYDDPDYSVDQRGWRPPAATIDGGPLPGIGGVLQAEHNMLVHLSRFPEALSLRRVLDGQRILSHQAARRAPDVAPELIEGWLEREQTYKNLMGATRNVGGIVGNGGAAVAEAANAVSRMRELHVDEITSAEPLRDLNKLFTRADARIASIIEQGAAERLYFVSVKVPRIVDGTGQLVSPVRERYMPVSAAIDSDLLAITRYELRPPPISPTASEAARESRRELRESIDHRPERRASPPNR
ncbi:MULTISPECIES: hypothetical protein [unclassified Nocardioides]|uniref:hypothetical protein n=1 Tax=unclassified Nocardioides TaxID=2615069 RepID=UPI0006F21BE8|nr:MULTISPECIES: hypothetical protein [unclassified Nocardioides]KRA37903.1 hypothetical protein ASD81_04255 [Nocardioides sp. Root614]KRA91863.1 hypothetical protein ASD84_04520 [Nocardioides sp. Root682]